MRNIILSMLFVLIFSTALSAADAIVINDAWVLESPPGMKMSEGFMTIKNQSEEDLVLTGVSSPQFGLVEMHLTEIDRETAKMVRQGRHSNLRPAAIT